MPGYDLVPSPKDDLGRDGNMDGSEREYVQTPVPTSRPTLDVGAGEALMRYTTRDLGGSYLEALSLWRAGNGARRECRRPLRSSTTRATDPLYPPAI